MESRSPCGCATATGPVVCMQPDRASAVTMAVIGNRNARETRTGAIPHSETDLVLHRLWLTNRCCRKSVDGSAVQQLSSADAGDDRARHAGAAKPAIAGWILGEILLVIVLGEIEFARGRDLGGDGAQTLGLQRRLIGRFRSVRRLALRVTERVDRGTILGADIIALTHTLGRVVAFPKR